MLCSSASVFRLQSSTLSLSIFSLPRLAGVPLSGTKAGPSHSTIASTDRRICPTVLATILPE